MVLMSNPAAVASSTGAAGSSSLAEWAQQYSVETTPLGRGSFASVYKGVNRETKEPVAIKVMTKARLGERALQMLAGEISILRTLEHPNVVCLRDSHTTERRILIVLEFCGGGDLGQYIQARGPSPEATARHFMLQLAAGLAFLCSRRLIHRDIKPQNLLLSERSSRASLKIADFGLARHLPQGSLAESMLGSPLYMAPEVLGNRAYDAKADLWSTGAVLYELVTAKHPFGGANQTELIDNIRRNRPRLPPGVTLSPACVELLGMLLVPQPSERASLQTFLSCSFLSSVETTSRSGGGGGGDVRNNSAASPRTQQLPPLPSPRVTAEPKLSVHPTPPFEVVPATERLSDGGVHPAGNAPQKSRLGSSGESRDPEMRQGSGVQEGAGGARSAAVSRIGSGGGSGGGGEESPGAQASQRRVGSALAPPSSGRLVGESNAAAATAASGSGSGGVGSAAAAVSARGSGVAAGAGVPAGGVRYSSGSVDPRGASGSSGRERVDHKVSTDAVGGRDGEWGWDWGGRGAPAGSGAAAAAGGVASGQIGGIAIGISDEGPLPSLPALPFALEPLGMPRSFAEAGGGVSGDDGVAAPPVFAFDLAFARSPVRDRSPTAAGGVRGRRSFSVSDADTAGEAPRLPAGPDMSRRKRIEGEVGSVVEGTSAVAARSAPPLAVDGAAADAATAAAAAAAAAAATPGRRRSHSFSGQGLAPGQTRPTEAANARSESPGARKTFATSGGSGGRSGAPEPVVYLGRAGSVSGLSVSPLYGQSSPVRRIPPERSGDGTTGILTPPSPAYYVSGGDASGGGSGSGAAGGNEGQVAMSPQRGYPSPVNACHQSTSPTSPGGSGQQQQQQQQQHYHQQYQHQPTPTLQPGTMPGGGGGGGGGGTADAGLPMLIKPSFRGSDSLLTIPEDSTGFVLVTRPPSISCEHGPGCECWAWSAGGGGGAGGLGGAVRSPSASYLASANPYGGPGKAAAAASAAAAAAAAAAGAGRRSGGVAFLGLGNIWNTAVNTFRGVAGAHGRRTSWPTRRGGAAGQQQQRGSLASVPPQTASAVPPGVGGGAGPGPGAGASGGSSREYLSPRSAQAQYRNASGGAGISSGVSGGGSRSGSSSSGGSSSGSGGGGGRGGGRNDPSLVQQGAQGLLPVDNSIRSDAVYLQQHHHGGVMLASPADEAGSRTAQRPQPRCSNNNPPQPQQAHHHRRHSEPTVPRPYPSGPERGGVGGRSAASLAWSPAEAAEARRVGAAADRAEIAGKRSILVVTLADKTAQEAMALALESPRDSRGASAAGAGAGPPAPAAVKHVGGASMLHAKRRHGMLTEALSLYVRALSILQGALPAVLVECDGVSADRFAAWNPLGAHHHQQQQQLQRQQQQQEQQQKRFGRSSPPSPALLSQRSALVTKASWLKDLFSQTLDRAEHCRTQASVASAAVASAAAASSSPSASSGEGASGSTGCSSSTAFTKDGRAFGPGAPWATLGGGGGSSGGASGTPPPPSDAAAAAVYRSAMEHGQEAAVCYLLGRSDAAVTHYVRACALLQLLALEPEMAGASAEEGGLRSGGGGGSSGSEVGGAGGMHARGGKGQEQPQQQQRAGWQAQLLATADMYARRVELISRGDVTAERQGFVYEEGRNG